MYVRLKDSAKGPAGKWSDAATGEHGDLLDVIRENCSLVDFKDVVDEARTFLSMPPSEPMPASERQAPAPHGSPEAARRLISVAYVELWRKTGGIRMGLNHSHSIVPGGLLVTS
jgi:hypothetical protein